MTTILFYQNMAYLATGQFSPNAYKRTWRGANSLINSGSWARHDTEVKDRYRFTIDSWYGFNR